MKNYLAVHVLLSTRADLDVTAAVGIFCRYSYKPNKVHWMALKMILRYLSGTKEYVVSICVETTDLLAAYCDVD